jgi:hypothetical protein
MCSQGIRAASESTFVGSTPTPKLRVGSPESRKHGAKNAATRMISRVGLPPDYFLRRRAFSTFFPLGPARFMARLTSPSCRSFSLRIGPRNPGPQPLVFCLGFDRASFVPCCHLLPDQSCSASRFIRGRVRVLALNPMPRACRSVQKGKYSFSEELGEFRALGRMRNGDNSA